MWDYVEPDQSSHQRQNSSVFKSPLKQKDSNANGFEHESAPYYSMPQAQDPFVMQTSQYYNSYGQPSAPQQQPYNPYNKNFGAGYNLDQDSYYSNTQQQQQQQQTRDEGYYNPLGAIPQQLLADPMVNVMKDYGERVAQQQKEKISRFVSWERLRFYFAVDNAYVGKKLARIIFPFLHREWSVLYSCEEEPVPPRLDVNAPDLYLPLMAVVTYLVVAGALLGVQGSFSPEQLGSMGSNVLAWLIMENLVILVTKYAMNISAALSFWHGVAFSSYKFVGMILCLVAYLLLGRQAYYPTLIYCSVAIAFFLLRTVKGFFLESPKAFTAEGTKRKLYLLLYISLTQPFIMWWLTSSLATSRWSSASAGPGIKASDGFKLNSPEIPLDMLKGDV